MWDLGADWLQRLYLVIFLEECAGIEWMMTTLIKSMLSETSFGALLVQWIRAGRGLLDHTVAPTLPNEIQPLPNGSQDSIVTLRGPAVACLNQLDAIIIHRACVATTVIGGQLAGGGPISGFPGLPVPPLGCVGAALGKRWETVSAPARMDP